MKTAAPRKFILLAGIAIACLSTSPLQAGTKEIAAINSQLALITPGATIGTATTADLSTATVNALKSDANKSLNPSTIAGEALKGAGSNAAGIGTQLATDVLANIGVLTGSFPKIALNLKGFVGGAAVTASTSTGANAAQVPSFAAAFIANIAGSNDTNLRNAAAISTAEQATKSTTAIGAILGGRNFNGDLDTAQERIDLAKTALADKKLTKASQQIAQYVGDAVVDDDEAASFALAVVKGVGTTTTPSGNSKYIVQIATGTSTSNPSAASKVVDAMFDGVTGNLAVVPASISPFFTAAVKNAKNLASKVGFVADTEQVQAVGVALGSRVGLTNTDPGTGKVKTVGISQSSVSALAKGLVLGLTTRPTRNSVTTNGDNRANRIDEIGEVGAYLLNSIKSLPVFQVDSTANRKNAPKLVTSLLKTIISASAKVWSDAQFALTGNTKKSVVKDTAFQSSVADDASGGIGLTLFSLQGQINAQIFASIKASLTAANAGTKIAGKTLGPTVLAALTAGINNTGNSSQIYEDGTIAANAIDVISSAETDIRAR